MASKEFGNAISGEEIIDLSSINEFVVRIYGVD